ncbi:MAG: FAD binding domain-containing protein, partial [Rubrimonas sp.]
MKAASLSYARAASIEEALALLARGGEAARVLAGGQSLVPALNLRLIEGPLLVDIGRIDALRGVALADGALRLGALTRHAELAIHPLVAAHAPMLAQAAPLIAHAAIRAKGTLGGSIAHADPAAELPACLLALDATVEAQGPQGARRIAAADFFLGMFRTALAPDEIVTAVEVPLAAAGRRHAVRELARRSGDYAIAGLALAATPAGGA